MLLYEYTWYEMEMLLGFTITHVAAPITLAYGILRRVNISSLIFHINYQYIHTIFNFPYQNDRVPSSELFVCRMMYRASIAISVARQKGTILAYLIMQT